MVRKVNEQGIIAVITRAQRLSGKLGNCATDSFKLRKDIEFVVERDIDRSKVLVVEWDWVRSSLDVDYGFPCRVPDGKLVEYIRIVI
jgi:hypothetical protein